MDRRAFLGLSVAASLRAQQPAAMPPPPKARITSSVMLCNLQGAFEQKLATAARAGLQSVELLSEYAGWSDAETTRFRRLCRSFGLGIDLLSANPDWPNRPVSMLDPAHREAFLADVRRAAAAARKLEAPHLSVKSGNTIPGRSREEQYRNMVEAAKRAADIAAASDLTLVVEPLNDRVDHKGCFLTTCGEGLKLAREVDNPRFRMVFDLYHEQVQAGNVIPTLTEAAPYVSVFHVADAPGRHEPGTGEMDYPAIYKAIQKTGFAGYVAMEYFPTGDEAAGLTKAVSEFRAALAG
jgi:hydroxypyruvate isomerase